MPKNEIGYTFCAVFLVFSAILNALLFGDVAGLIVNNSKEELVITDITDKNNNIINEFKL